MNAQGDVAGLESNFRSLNPQVKSEGEESEKGRRGSSQ